MTPWIIPISLLIFFELVADIFAEEWSIHGRYVLWIAAIVSYIIANTFWLYALKQGSGLAKGAVIFSVTSAIFATALGIIMYKEVLTKVQLFGVLLGITSLIFIFWE